MENLTLTILAQDIRETDYSNNEDCAITRALKRAGHGDCEDNGLRILDKDGSALVDYGNESYNNMADEVIQMYRTKRGFDCGLPIIDRTYIIEIK